MSTAKIFFLHALGSSAREWSEVIEHLGGRYDCVALDLPGFGQTPLQGRTNVTALVDWFCEIVVGSGATTWLVVGHSMGAKIATVAASRAQRGEAGLAGLAGVVLLAGSPSAPEPMDESRRENMLSWTIQGQISRGNAERFVSDNVADDLPELLRERAIEDVIRTDPLAWNAWLEVGSREDWSSTVGSLAFPSCIVAGAKDGDLGLQAQIKLNLPHYHSTEQVEVIDDAAHLLPYEQPEEVARKIDSLAALALTRALPDTFIALLNSTRTDLRMRTRLIERNLPPDPNAQGILGERSLQVLQAIASLVVNQSGNAHELARRIDIALASGQGDGWRFAELPADSEAWSIALRSVDQIAGGFCELAVVDQAAVLQAIQGREMDAELHGLLSTKQLALWFEDACAQIARVWISSPAAMAMMGYDGFAVALNDGVASGYEQVGPNQVESWQLGAGRV